MGDKMDTEIDQMLAVLLEIQEKVGGPKQEEHSINPAFKDDRFLALKEEVLDKLKEIRQLLNEKAEAANFSSKLESVKIDQQIRTLFKETQEFCVELQQLNQVETRKRKSKFTKEELTRRHEIVVALQEEIEELKNMQKQGGQVNNAPTNKILRMEDHEIFKKPAPGAQGGPGVKYEQEQITDAQRLRLQQIQARDKEFDQAIELIGEGVDALHEKAQVMGQEVDIQGQMLEDLKEQVDSAAEKLLNVNQKLKGTLDAVDRGEGKCCMDILCLLVLLGMIAVLVQIWRNG